MSDTHNFYNTGDKVKVELPYSEVCAYMKVAGQVMTIEILARGVQLYDEAGKKFSFPITHGEAGVHESTRMGDTEERWAIPKSAVRD